MRSSDIHIHTILQNHETSFEDQVAYLRKGANAYFEDSSSDNEDDITVPGYEFVGRGRCRDGSGERYPWIATLSTYDEVSCGVFCDQFRLSPNFQGFYWSPDASRHEWNENDEKCRCLFDAGTDLDEVESGLDLPDTWNDPHAPGNGEIASVRFDESDVCYKVAPEKNL